MSDPQVWYDLDFRFTSGERVTITALEGRDAIQDSNHCTHCGRAGITKVTVKEADTLERTVTIHHEKLDAVDSTKRTETKELTREYVLDTQGNLMQD